MDERADVKIILEIAFSSFSGSKRSAFIKDFANLIGCKIEEITDIKFASGCTIFYSSLPKEFAEIAESFFSWVVKNPECEENKDQYTEIRAFFKKYQVIDFDFQHDKVAEFVKKVSAIELQSKNNAILFVHGWSGDENSFGILPNSLEKRTGCIPLLYKYPTGVWQKSAAVPFIASNMFAWISRNIRDGIGDIAIVAHSMGGLVVRKMLVDQMLLDRRIEDRIRHISFVASPYSGSSLAKIASFVPLITKSQIHDLDPDSPFLYDLNRFWRIWVQKRANSSSSIRAIFGTNDNIVGIASAMIDDSNPVPLIGKGHVDIIKPSEENEEIVLVLEDFYRETGLARVNA